MNLPIKIATLAFLLLATCPLASSAFAIQGESLQSYASPTAPQQRYLLGFTGVDLPGAGVQIRSVVPGGPMTRMTMVGNPTLMQADPGDIIVAINGVATPTMASLAAQLARAAPQGGHCRITLRNINNGMNQDFNAVATPQPIAPPPPQQQSYSLGITAQESPGQGIIVSSLTPGGPATQLADPINPGARNIHLDPGDIITAINGMPTLSGAQYQAAMQALSATAGNARLTLRDVRTGQLRTLNAIATVNQNPAPSPNPNPNPWPAPNPNPGNNFDPNAPRKVHVVIAGQSGTRDQGFNSCIRTSLNDLDQMLTRIGDQFLGSKTVLRDGNCTADQIRNTLNRLRPAPQDTVFFYYTGHGAQNAAGHFLQTSATAGGDLPRQEVAQILQRHNVRLSVFISEACNAAGEPKQEARARSQIMNTNSLTELEDLLLTYSGYIDLNSSDTGQYGWGTPTLGGFFTNVFSRETLGLGASNGWNAKLNDVAQKVNAMFQKKKSSAIALGGAPQKLINQQALTPKIYALQTQKTAYNVNPGQRQFQQASMFYVTVPGN